jgi:hypothetical protein
MNKRIAIEVLYLAAGVVVLFLVWTRSLPVTVYYSTAGIVAILLAYFLTSNTWPPGRLITHIYVISLLVGGLYYVSTRFQVLPWGDPYGQYWLMIKVFHEAKVSLSGGPDIPWGVSDFYASWPGLQFLGTFVSRVTGINPLPVALLLPWIFQVLLFAAAFLFTREVSRGLGWGTQTVPIVLLTLVTSPFLAEAGPTPVFKYQYFAASLAVLFFYVWCRASVLSTNSRAWFILAVALLAAIGMSHNFTSIVLGFLAIVALVVSRVWASPTKAIASSARYAFVMVSLIVPLSWLVYVGQHSFLPLALKALRIAFGQFQVTGTVSGALGSSFYSVPSPRLGVLTLLLRDLLMFGGAIAGGMSIWKLRSKSFVWVILITGLLATAVGLTLDVVATFSVFNFRALAVLAPFVAIGAGRYWSNHIASGRRAGRLMAGLTMALFAFSSLTGQWAHLYLPQHLYNPKVALEDAGEHPPNWRWLAIWFRRSVRMEEVRQVVTDERYVLGLMIPYNSWDKIRVIGGKDSELEGNTLIVSLRGLNPHSYIAQLPASWMPSREFLDAEVAKVELLGSIIYSDGRSFVWRLD